MSGRFAEVAALVVVALERQPASARPLLEIVRGLGGWVGIGTFLGAVARLERAGFVERTTIEGLPLYRLTKYSRAAAR